jgi:neurotransmitter:Na+ symporter, NSS family
MELEKKQNSRDGFSSRFGVIAAAAGSAIGLGNIWRFPYIAGQGGGAAFILIYACFIILIGMSCLLVEFLIGRRSQRDAIGAFHVLVPRKPWVLGGWIAIITVILIFAFYSVVFGWTLDYLIKSICNNFADKTPIEIAGMFETTTSNIFKPIAYTFIGIGLTTIVIVGGVKKGIEKYTKILMPLLFVLLIVLVIRSLMLPNSSLGLAFLFKPDFSKVTGHTVLIALGQAFFTLSLGSGAMITYGSYIKKKEKLASTVVYTCILNSSVSILAGIAIFPAVFSFGIAPSQGPSLAFITLPNIFQQMFGGYVFSIVFFLLMGVAALTSTISMLEAAVAALTEGKGVSRKKAAIWFSVVIAFLSIPCSLSFGVMSNFKILGLNTFNLFDYITANLGMTIASIIYAVFVGWFLGKDKVRDELSNSGLLTVKYFPVFMFIVRFVVPAGIIIVFLSSMGFIG